MDILLLVIGGTALASLVVAAPGIGWARARGVRLRPWESAALFAPALTWCTLQVTHTCTKTLGNLIELAALPVVVGIAATLRAATGHVRSATTVALALQVLAVAAAVLVYLLVPTLAE